MNEKKKPKPSPVVFVRVPLEMKKALGRVCDSERRTEREVVMAALRQYLFVAEAKP